MQITVRDIEREHRTQLKRWKKKRGEPSRRQPQRMHSARAIMASEPHTRQDLRQQPTIIVKYPSIPEEKSESNIKKKRGTLKRKEVPIPDVPNPYALPSESPPSPISEIQPPNTENTEVIPPHPPSQPPPLPIQEENQMNTFIPPPPQFQQSSSNISVNQRSADSLPLQNLSLLPAPVLESPTEWRPHLLDSPPAQFPEPVPNFGDLPNKTGNSAATSYPSTHSNPLLTHNAPANSGSSEDKNGVLFNSTESVNSAEDTYL